MHRASLLSSAALGIASFVAGCSPSWALTRTSALADARAADCEVRLLTAAPEGEYDEIGILDQSGHGDIRNAGDFLASVRSHVCAAGGNAIVPRLSGTAQYMGGTVLSLR